VIEGQKPCRPWRWHDWTRWKPEQRAATRYHRFTGETLEDNIVVEGQTRECQRCGKTQWQAL